MIESLQETPSLILLVFLVVLVLMGIVIWSIKRHRSPKLKVDCDASIDDLVPTLAGLTVSTAHHGNSVEVLINGKFWDVLIERIGAAEHTISFETFLWKEGKLGQRMADALSARARAGVKVRVMLDATGSKNAGRGGGARMHPEPGRPARNRCGTGGTPDAGWSPSTSARSIPSACSTTATTASWW